jgi:transcriptional regulator with XRE-family HTH domain
MRYDIKVTHEGREITVKGSKELEGTWKLNEFLKRAREISNCNAGYIHMATDISPKRLELLEKGDIPYMKDDVQALQRVFKFNRKILKLLDIEKPLWAYRITETRSHYHMTQQQISDKLGISQTTYAGYETGRHQPDIETMIKLADLYNVDLNYLMGRYTKTI